MSQSEPLPRWPITAPKHDSVQHQWCTVLYRSLTNCIIIQIHWCHSQARYDRMGPFHSRSTFALSTWKCREITKKNKTLQFALQTASLSCSREAPLGSCATATVVGASRNSSGHCLAAVEWHMNGTLSGHLLFRNDFWEIFREYSTKIADSDFNRIGQHPSLEHVCVRWRSKWRAVAL